MKSEAKGKLRKELGFPSAYAETNVKEDFAENFVEFMTHPERMPEQRLHRMKRTLWLSGFGGKEVVRLARFVAQDKAMQEKISSHMTFRIVHRYLWASARKTTMGAVKRNLQDSRWHLDFHNKALMVRGGDDISPGMKIDEFRPTKMIKGYLEPGPAAKATFRVTWYQGENASRRWESETFDKLRDAVAYLNTHREEAEANYPA